MVVNLDLRQVWQRRLASVLVWAAAGTALAVAGMYAMARLAPQRARPAAPTIALSHLRLDLGEGRPGQQLEGSFTVTNQGTKLLEFMLSPTCGCAFVRPMGGRLKPGQSQKISLGIRLPQTANSEKTTQIVIRSNDPRRPRLTCTVTARAPAPWQVSPSHINFGYVLREELRDPPRQRLVVRPGSGKNGLPTSALRAHLAGDAYVLRSEPHEDGSLVIEVSLRRGLADGRYSSQLELGHSTDPAAVTIGLDAEVGPAVALVPTIVYLSQDESTGAYRPAQVVAVARKRSLVVGGLRPVNWPNGVQLRRIGAQSGRFVRYQVELDAAARLPPDGLHLELQCVGRGERLQLTLFPEADRRDAEEFQPQQCDNEEH